MKNVLHRSLGLSLLLIISACGSGGRLDTAAVSRGDTPVGAATAKAGVAVVDVTPDVGYCAGQYCDYTSLPAGLAGGDIDPFVSATLKAASYGVQSRQTVRAIVVEGSNGKRIVLLKSDNYLAQNALIRRVGQILAARGSGITPADILYHVTHNHSSSYSSTPAVGVALFEDAFDPRFFEHQARQIAAAILAAEADMRPVRMGATEIRHTIYKGNVVRPAVADDGTPAGYPREFGDHGLVVMRFDDISNPAAPEPLAVWVNWGEHPESLDGYNLHSADFLAAFERFVDRDLGVPVVYSQGDVGSAENTGNSTQILADDGRVCDSDQSGEGYAGIRAQCPDGQGVVRDWNHRGYVQTERAVRYLADDVLRGFAQIGRNDASVRVPFRSDFVVDARHYWAPGPLSHPYPAVSNCNSQTTVDGDIGVPVAGLPDCGRYGIPGDNPLTNQAGLLFATAQAEGIPLPDHYDATAFAVVEENARLYLQTMRLGEVLLASCACEAQVDLILNLESRTDDREGNIYDGFDWACLLPEYAGDPVYAEACALQAQYFDPEEFPTEIPGDNFAPDAIAHMRAQVHNDAAGWDSPANALFANTEPDDLAAIWGNFTKEELPAEQGYALAVGIGHAGDYNGYTVSYREYMNRDHYRKALTAYGAHTADYMVTRLVRMAGAMKGGPELEPEIHDAIAQADELRQEAETQALGQLTAAAYDAWLAAVPNDSGPAEIRIEPAPAVPRFAVGSVRWRGGNPQVDNPRVEVQKRCDGADFLPNVAYPQLARNCAQADEQGFAAFAEQSGEVPTRVFWPQGLPGVVSTYGGQFAWEWQADFEAYEAFPNRLGDTPLGEYRFVISGCINDGLEAPEDNATGRLGAALRVLAPDQVDALVDATFSDGCPGGSRPYRLESSAFVVQPFAGVSAPVSYESVFPYVQESAPEERVRYCEQCSFRPWVGS